MSSGDSTCLCPKWCALCLALAGFFSCATETPSEPSPGSKADAGPDRTVRVGQYTILDGSGSSSEMGAITEYRWTADEGNPTWTYLSEGEAVQRPGFYVEGVYRYRLVVLNSTGPSLPDEVVVTVIGRLPGIFADSCMELTVRYCLEMPTKEITEEDLLSLDSLRRVAGGIICSLKGIEKCINLRYAHLGGEAICDLSPLANLTLLEVLWLDQNHVISDVSPLAGLVHLKELSLASNQIEDLSPLVTLAVLEYLDISDNEKLRDISAIASMRNLRELWLQRSPLNSIGPIAGLAKLHTLWVAACGVRDIEPIASLSELRTLVLDFNQIGDITAIQDLTQLELLYLSENEIEDVSAMKSLVRLARLKLSNNRIVNIAPLVDNRGLGPGDLVTLDHNPLDSISVNMHIPALRERGVTVFWHP
jgi:hypothetical protein